MRIGGSGNKPHATKDTWPSPPSFDNPTLAQANGTSREQATHN